VEKKRARSGKKARHAAVDLVSVRDNIEFQWRLTHSQSGGWAPRPWHERNAPACFKDL